MIELFLFALPDWLTGANFLMGAIAFLVLVGVALLIIVSKSGPAQKDLADATQGVLKLKENELEQTKKECGDCREELEDLTAEYRALVGIKLKELFEYESRRIDELAEKEQLVQRVRVLEVAMTQGRNKKP